MLMVRLVQPVQIIQARLVEALHRVHVTLIILRMVQAQLQLRRVH